MAVGGGCWAGVRMTTVPVTTAMKAAPRAMSLPSGVMLPLASKGDKRGELVMRATRVEAS